MYTFTDANTSVFHRQLCLLSKNRCILEPLTTCLKKQTVFPNNNISSAFNNTEFLDHRIEQKRQISKHNILKPSKRGTEDMDRGGDSLGEDIEAKLAVHHMPVATNAKTEISAPRENSNFVFHVRRYVKQSPQEAQ